MAKVDAELLKKHHFWVLLIPYALLVGLAVLFIWMDVGAAASTKEKDVDKALAELKSQQPKSEALTKGYGEQKGELEVRRTKLWKATSEEQAGLFVWPKGFQKADRDLLGKTKFGTLGVPGAPGPLEDRIRQKFKDDDLFFKEYSDLVNSAYPIQFGPTNAWESVLQPINKWEAQPDQEEIWLAMEDLWVRQQMVALVHKVNRDVARFTKIDNAPGLAPRETLWRSRIWELTLKIEDDKGANLIKGKLKNVSDRIQPLGVRNVMFVKLFPVGSKPDAASDPNDDSAIGFPIEGELVKAGETITIKTLKEHRITDGNLTAIGQIEQVFDARTAPIKRLDRVALGYHSSRTITYPLKMSSFSQKIVDDLAAAVAATSTGTAGSPGSPGSPMAPPMGSGPPMAGMAFGGTTAGAGTVANDLTGYGLVRSRYIEMTTQVRRMPVGLLVVADQHFVPDLLTAATNSPLRFQTTQSNVKRFDGEIDYTASGNTAYSGSTAAPKDPKDAKEPVVGSPMIPGMPPMGMPGFNPYGRIGTGAGTSAGSFGTGTTASFSSDSQFSVNLVEFGLYGIVTLYEKFPTEAETAAASPTPAKK